MDEKDEGGTRTAEKRFLKNNQICDILSLLGQRLVHSQ